MAVLIPTTFPLLSRRMPPAEIGGEIEQGDLAMASEPQADGALMTTHKVWHHQKSAEGIHAGLQSDDNRVQYRNPGDRRPGDTFRAVNMRHEAA